MLQKVLKIGNSLGVTFPKKFVVENKIKPGSVVSNSPSDGSITFSTHVPKSTKYEQISDKEFLGLIKEVEARYGNALDELANLE